MHFFQMSIFGESLWNCKWVYVWEGGVHRMKQMHYIVVLPSEVLRGERVAVRLLPLRCVYTGGKRVMFIKSVHYILTFHIPQRMWEA